MGTSVTEAETSGEDAIKVDETKLEEAKSLASEL